MRNISCLFLFVLLFTSCQVEEKGKNHKTNWNKRISSITNFEDFVQGETYLPVYSHIYYAHEDRTFDLTITVSIRNVSHTDSVYILNADYYNTAGDKIRRYIENPVFVAPMETVEIVIKEADKEGGSGANFIFDWAAKRKETPPLFEAVMLSTYGQQGISFLTRGVPIQKDR